MAATKIIPIIKDDYGVRLKYPDRSCKDCKKYPCFSEIDKCKSDFGKYGCVNYNDNLSAASSKRN